MRCLDQILEFCRQKIFCVQYGALRDIVLQIRRGNGDNMGKISIFCIKMYCGLRRSMQPDLPVSYRTRVTNSYQFEQSQSFR